MSNDRGEAIFHAAKLLQLYEETESVEPVTEAAAALLAERPSDHGRQVAWFLPPELIGVVPKQHRARIVPVRPQLGSSAAPHGTPGSLATTDESRKAAASLPRR
jgi:hypothetical protein